MRREKNNRAEMVSFGAIRFCFGAIKKGLFAIICSQCGAVGDCWLTVSYSDSIVPCK